MEKSKYQPTSLTYEEHKKIDEFFRFFNEKGHEVFDLLRKSFGDHEIPVVNMAKAVNLLNIIPHICENRACFDRPTLTKKQCENPNDTIESEHFIKWQKLYYHIGLWSTEGWKE